MWDIFAAEYLVDHQQSRRRRAGALRDGHRRRQGGDRRRGRRTAATRRPLVGVGNGPIDAYVQALQPLGIQVRVLDYPSTRCPPAATPRPPPTSSARSDGATVWGVGLDANIVTASIKAVTSAVNRVSA